MADLMQWLNKHSLTNPHAVPDKLKDEFNELFGDADIMWPQPGGQEKFLNCDADVCIYGGAAGSGKSWSIILDTMKWINNPKYIGVISRKTFSLIFDAGCIWDESREVYEKYGGKPRRGDRPVFVFPSGAKIFFKHSQHPGDVSKNWQGIQATTIYLDEVTQYDKKEFLYITGRNRDSKSRIQPYIRATCNPDHNSWVKDIIRWWLDDAGYPILERSGVIRYYIHRDDKFIFADTKEELIEKYGTGDLTKDKNMARSFTFIPGNLDDNKILTDVDPTYYAALLNQDDADKHALLDGCWNELEKKGSMFPRSFFNDNRVDFIDFSEMEKLIITVDPAGEDGDSNDDTGIAILGKKGEHAFVFGDETGKFLPHEWAAKVIELYHTYRADRIVVEKNYGGAMVVNTIRGVDKNVPVYVVNATRGKTKRFQPVAQQYAKGCVHHVGHGLKKAEDELHMFDPDNKNQKSPNRGDAIAWGITELLIEPQAIPRIF